MEQQFSVVPSIEYTYQFGNMIGKFTLLCLAALFGVAVCDDHAHYKFAYGVHDPHTHDVKDQHEHRDGHHVDGEYNLHEPDGTHRIVKYKSDHKTGFEAVVDRHGIAKHPHGATSYVKVTHWGNQGH